MNRRTLYCRNTITLTFYSEHTVEIDTGEFAKRREHELADRASFMHNIGEAFSLIKKLGRGGWRVSVTPIRELPE